MMEKKILYFDKPGKSNTDQTLSVIRDRVKDLGIRQVIVASTHGYTAMKAKEALAGLDVEVIAVTICAGFDEKGWTITADERQRLENEGIKVLTTMHALGDDVNEALGTITPNRIVRETLYRFGQGMKVAVEIALMAADAGLIDMSGEVISLGGSGEGADTAIVMKPAFTRTFKQMKILEILAKPR
jgi:hypothetical protein